MIRYFLRFDYWRKKDKNTKLSVLTPPEHAEISVVRWVVGLWAERATHGTTTMRRGSAVNGCDHSFLVNNAALLIGWFNN